MNETLVIGKAVQPSIVKQVVILRALPGLGDFLCAVPAFRAMRHAFPIAQITLIGLSQANHLVDRFRHYIDAVLEFPGFPGIPEVPFAADKTLDFLNQMHQVKPDLALQMHGNGLHSNAFVQLLGAREVAGYFQSGYWCANPQRFTAYPDHLPEVERNLHLLNFLGIAHQGKQLEFPISELDWQELDTIASTVSLVRHYICIHPGASTVARCWQPQAFARVADQLAAAGFQIVLTGTRAEVGLTQAIARMMQSPVVNLAGKTSLGALAALLKRSRLLVCNDTGVSHLAAALNVNSVVIFSNSDPHRWAPSDRQRHRVIQIQPDDDRPFAGDRDPFHDASPAVSVEIDRVLTAAIDLLSQEVAYAS